MKSASHSLKLAIIVCIALVVMQSVFMIIPLHTLRLYNMAMKPLVYAALAVFVYVCMGIDQRRAHKTYDANMIAVLSVAMFGMVFLIVSFLFGAGQNAMAANPQVIVRNLWEQGSILIFGELMRYKLIRSSGQQNRTAVVVLLTITLAYGNMNAMRMLAAGDVIVWSVFFESIFKPLVISAVASYFAMEGSFTAVLIISFVYTMAAYIVPILPDISPIVWSLIISGLVFATAIIYNFATNEKRRDLRMREKRAARYVKKPMLSNTVTVMIIGGIVMFFVGVFPIYPVVILTGSMTGTFDRGSLVFVERVPSGEAFTRVDEGYVIHFISRSRAEYIHRVIDFRFDAYGERQYITRGDASYLTDPFPVSQDDVLGIARAQIPFIGYPYIIFRAIFQTFN